MAKNSDKAIENISLSSIDPNPDNKTIFNMSDIDHLASIIKEVGFTTPIEVMSKDDGRYEIISGHRRYEAMRLLGEKTIPCVVTPMIKSTPDRAKRLISDNIAQRRITPLELAKAIEKYKEVLKEEGFKGDTRSKVANYFNVTQSSVYRHECLLKLIPELQEYANKPLFPYSCLRQASTLSKSEQYELYKELIDLEASERDIEPDEVDRDELVLSRTRIEQIINNKIRAKENAQKRADEEKITQGSYDEDEEDKYENTDTAAEDDFENVMNEPVDVENDSLNEFVINKDSGKTLETGDIFDEVESGSSAEIVYFKGIDSCIATIDGYTNNIQPPANTKDFKEKLKQLREKIERLEKML